MKKKTAILVLVLLSTVAFSNVSVTMAPPAGMTDVLVYGGPGPQNEVSIAVNPLKPDNIVVGFNDHTGPKWMASYAYSTDGGSTWTYGGQLPRGTLTGQPFCDPWLAFDSSGYLYYVALSNSSNREIFVCVGRPDGAGNVGPLGFGSPQIVDSTYKNDKPVIAVDTTGGPHDGNIYVAWAHKTTPGNYKIWFRRGTRTGLTTITWTEPGFQVSPAGVLYTQGPQVAVGKNGEVYVAHLRMTSASIPDGDAILFSRSLSGGAPGTWTMGTVVSSVTAVSWLVSPDSWARHTSFPTLGVSNTTGTIFIAWADSRNGDDDILLSRSTDSGSTWLATPKRVNTDALGNGKDQWHPALTVNSLGSLDVIFYDRRDDPSNELTMLYAARSTNEGNTFTNWRVSDEATDPDAFFWWESASLGDYNGIDSVGSTTYVGWGDGRNGDPGPPIDYNSDVYFEKWTQISLCLGLVVLVPCRKHVFTCIPPSRCSILICLRVLSTCGFNGSVDLWAEGIPPGAEYSFEPGGGEPPFETTFKLTFPEFEEGTYEVKIMAGYGAETSSTSVEVGVTTTPYILLGVNQADPEDIVTLEGHGFTFDSFFDVFFDGKLVYKGKTDLYGVISTEIEIPSDTPDGLHTVVVKDEADVEASAALSTPLGNVEEAEECTYELRLFEGWNMVSFPTLPDDPSFSSIFSGVGFYQVLTWDGTSYVTPSTAEAGVGYWVLVLEETSVCLSTHWEGNPVANYAVDLPAGWSMIGSILPCIVDAGCVFPSFYQLLTWDGTSYIPSTIILPGKGYWALVLVPTHIVVDISCCIP